MQDSKNNLKPVRTTEEARARGKKGGIASGKARREKKRLKTILNLLLEEEAGLYNGKKVDRKELLAIKTIRMASEETDPDKFVKMLTFIRDTIGEKPVDTVAVNNVSGESVKALERLIYDEQEGKV